MNTTYTIHFTNFGYTSQHTATDLEGAKKIARDAGFESGIYKGQELVATFSPIGGFRSYPRPC